jgi:hypothetical protein
MGRCEKESDEKGFNEGDDGRKLNTIDETVIGRG